jgi:hypothetical protein
MEMTMEVCTTNRNFQDVAHIPKNIRILYKRYYMSDKVITDPYAVTAQQRGAATRNFNRLVAAIASNGLPLHSTLALLANQDHKQL